MGAPDGLSDTAEMWPVGGSVARVLGKSVQSSPRSGHELFGLGLRLTALFLPPSRGVSWVICSASSPAAISGMARADGQGDSTP